MKLSDLKKKQCYWTANWKMPSDWKRLQSISWKKPLRHWKMKESKKTTWGRSCPSTSPSVITTSTSRSMGSSFLRMGVSQTMTTRWMGISMGLLGNLMETIVLPHHGKENPYTPCLTYSVSWTFQKFRNWSSSSCR